MKPWEIKNGSLITYSDNGNYFIRITQLKPDASGMRYNLFIASTSDVEPVVVNTDCHSIRSAMRAAGEVLKETVKAEG